MTREERIKSYNEFMPMSERIQVEILEMIGFFSAPASTKHHGAYKGGLFDHSLAVTEELVRMTKKLELKWKREESPYIVGMYHDLCKCEAYIWEEENKAFTYNNDMIIPGHGDKSVIMASAHIRLTEEEIACIRWHMGAFEKDTKMWGYYGRAIEKYPNVLYTHTADMAASRIRGI